MAETNREEAEKACRRAEELFLAGNITGAHRLARKAQRLFPSLPGLANALAAYDVHAAAAAAANPDWPNWHAVLRVDQTATPDDVKKRFRRLSLLVHPDKNHSAAAEGAFKLLRQACDALSSSHHPNDSATAAAQSWFRSHTAKYQARPPADDASPRSRARKAARQGPPCMLIYCRYCRNGFDKQIRHIEETAGVLCVHCSRWLRPPWERPPEHAYPVEEPSPARPPPPPPKPPLFPCPGQCPHCGTQFASMVSAGKWCLRCKACNKHAIVNVQGPNEATCCSR